HRADRVRRTREIHPGWKSIPRIVRHRLQRAGFGRRLGLIEERIDRGESVRPGECPAAGDERGAADGIGAHLEPQLLSRVADEEAVELVVVGVIREALGVPERSLRTDVVEPDCGGMVTASGDREASQNQVWTQSRSYQGRFI